MVQVEYITSPHKYVVYFGFVLGVKLRIKFYFESIFLFGEITTYVFFIALIANTL